MKNKIVLADNQSIFSAGLKLLLEREDEFQVIHEVSEGESVMQAVEVFRPDLLILDPSTSGNGIDDTVGKVKISYPHVKVLVLTTFKDEAYVRASLKTGAEGYILKDATIEELLIAVRAIEGGNYYLSPGISRQIVVSYLKHPAISETPKPLSSDWSNLTNREREVLVLVAEGKKNKEIAGFLSLSIKTIEKHRASMMNKLKFKNTPALIYYAMENGLLSDQYSSTVQ